MKTCPLCGKQNPDQNKFCSYCGTELSEPDADKTLPSLDEDDQDQPIIEVPSSNKDANQSDEAKIQTPEEKENLPNLPEEMKGESAAANSNPWRSCDTFAIIGMGLAVAGSPLPGLIFAILGLKSHRLHGLAVAGLVISIIGLVVYPILYYFYFRALLGSF